MLKKLKEKIRQKIISEHKSLFSGDKVEEEELSAVVKNILDHISSFEHMNLSDSDKKTVLSDVINEFVGLGPIELLLKDPEITEIMINGPDRVYVEKRGKKELSNITFDNEQQLMYFIHKILAPTRRRVDESFPYTDVSLKDGSRVNIIIPPLALNGPTITIRRFSKNIVSIDDLVSLNTLDKRIADFLTAAIKIKANVIFSGATGVGKTTTLNVLSSYIGDDERIVTIEDTAELNLKQEHVVRLETRPANIEGKGEVSIRELFRNSLRMRPDRIIIGEIRSDEALDMLQAICSGHRGSLAIIHASSPQEVIYRLETIILTSGLPIGIEAIHRQIAASINIIVQQDHLPDGSRKITHVTQINGIRDREIVLEDIFLFDIESVETDGKIKGRWKATGVVPALYPLFKKSGIDFPRGIFTKE